MTSRRATVAAVQMVSGPVVSENLDEAGRQIAAASAAGAQLVVLPENFALMPLNDADRLGGGEPDGKGPTQVFLATQSRQHRVWLVGGTIPLAAKTAGKGRGGCLMFNDRG